MIPVFTAAQMRAADQYTIRHEPVQPMALMERAATSVTRQLLLDFPAVLSADIYCGSGNNGGDGWAIARQLLERGIAVRVIFLQGKQTQENMENEMLFRAMSGHRIEPAAAGAIPLPEADIVVDAVFGSGLNRPPDGLAAEMISAINRARVPVVCVDIPSGMFADMPTQSGTYVKGTITYTFQLPKLAFLLPENDVSFRILDIGISSAFIRETEVHEYLIEGDDIRGLLHPRNRFAHKGDFGHALLVAGSRGKMGAAILASRACLRCGAGLVTAGIPGWGMQAMQSAIPEAMCLELEHGDTVGGSLPPLDAFDAIACGPGIGVAGTTKNFLKDLMRSAEVPMVLDADALNLIALHKDLRDWLRPGMVLTPHPGEFRRLVGEWTDGFHCLSKLRQFSAETGAVVVLKGAHTAIATPGGKVYFNSTGNPGMATGGSGDVLTGMIVSLLAQGLNEYEAAVCGVYLHGLSGDLAARQYTQPGMIAGDIVTALPRAWRRLGL